MFEVLHDNNSKLANVPSDDMDQLGNLSSLIRSFVVSSVAGYYPKRLFFWLADSDN